MKFNKLRNEQGFVLVFALMIMAMLTIIGLAIISNTIFELKISGNDKVSRELLYIAESAAMEAAQKLDNETSPDNLKAKRTTLKWLFVEKDKGGTDTKDELITNPSKWDDPKNRLASGMGAADGTAKLAAVDLGPVKGQSSLDMADESNKMYGFAVLGHSSKYNGEKTVEIGYRKRY